jgi:hypothetical protein
VSNPCTSFVGGGGGGLTIRLPPNNESATLLPAKMYELEVVDVVAFVNGRDPKMGSCGSALRLFLR